MRPAPSRGVLALLRRAVELGASDLHLTVGNPPILRVNGQLTALEDPALKDPALGPAECLALARELASAEQLASYHHQHQLSFSRHFEGIGNFRINIYRHAGHLEAAVRASAARPYTLAELGVPAVLGELVRQPSGLILITGPTGTGKTTTFNALLHRINAESACKIITIEDPVEFRHPRLKGLVIQQEVGLDTPDFATALRHALRQDPDVIAVGELRDLESISTALTAAETGHLVLATLHTPNAPGTISRIVDVFPAWQQNQIRSQLAGTLLAVMAQRLVSRADGGRVLLADLLLVNDAVRTLVREGRNHMLANQMVTSRGLGMLPMDYHLRELLARGVVTPQVARQVVQDPTVIKDLV